VIQSCIIGVVGVIQGTRPSPCDTTHIYHSQKCNKVRCRDVVSLELSVWYKARDDLVVIQHTYITSTSPRQLVVPCILRSHGVFM